MEFNTKVNAFDYSDLVKGGFEEISAAINLYKELGCPHPSKIIAEEVVLHPIIKRENGDIVFGAYCYEASESAMNRAFSGFKSHPNVVEVYDEFNTTNFGGEMFVDGEFFVVVKL